MSADILGFGEGDVCNRDGCKGVIATHPSENCSCHISPPCFSCTSPRGFCPECDWQEADEPPAVDVFNDRLVKRGTWIDMGPRPLDPTKLDWHSKPHSNSSMIKEGVYPPGMTSDEVRKAVNGTFGGRFEYFNNCKFKFIAYTD